MNVIIEFNDRPPKDGENARVIEQRINSSEPRRIKQNIASTPTKDPIIQWVIDFTQSEGYYLLDMSFMLVTSWYLSTNSTFFWRPQSLFIVLNTLSMVTSAFFYFYLGHKFYLRDTRFEMIIDRIISLIICHFLQFSFSVIAISFCLAGSESNHVDDTEDTFYCNPTFLALNCIKIIWHCYSFWMFFYFRWKRTLLAWIIYTTMTKVGYINVLQPFFSYDYLKASVKELVELLDEYEMVQLNSLSFSGNKHLSANLNKGVTSPTSTILSADATQPLDKETGLRMSNSSNSMSVGMVHDIVKVTDEFIDDEIGKIPTKEEMSTMNWYTLISRITQTEAYFLFDSMLILSSSWYTTFGGSGDMPAKQFVLLMCLSLGSTLLLFLYLSHKFYLRMNRSEALIDRTIALLISHFMQLGSIASVVFCADGEGGNHIDDGNLTFTCTTAFLAATYFKVCWHTISIIMALTFRFPQTYISCVAYHKMIFVGVLNILETRLNWEYLEKQVLFLVDYMKEKNSQIQ
jgi:hypothetical protein